MVNMNHLRSFYVCALHRNVTKAAEVLNVSQPSVSQQIKIFEEEIGFAVFYRNGRTLELTAEGRRLFNKSQTVFESLIGIEDFIENRSEISGSIYLSTSAEIERPFVAKITSELVKSSIFKDAQFYINSISHDDLPKAHDKHDQLVLTHEKISSLKLVQEFTFPVKLISKMQNIEVSQTKRNSLNALLAGLGQKLIIPSKDHKLRQELENYLDLKNQSATVLMESNIMACLTEAVREGLGCSLLPIQYVYDDVRKNKLSVYGPANGFWEHKLFLYSTAGTNPSVSKEVTRIIQKFSIQKGG